MVEAFLAVLRGLPMTILVTVVAFVIGLFGGIPLMLALRSRSAVLRLASRLLVDVIRGVPPLVWLFLLYFGFQVGTMRLTSLAAAIAGLGIVAAAYLAEIYRGGFVALPVGQVEAAGALGLDRFTVFTRILVPQAFRIVLPSMAAFLLSLLKDSAIASTIGVTDMVFEANVYTRQHPDVAGLLPFFIAAVLYFAMSLPLAILTRRLDARLRRAH